MVRKKIVESLTFVDWIELNLHVRGLVTQWIEVFNGGHALSLFKKNFLFSQSLQRRFPLYDKAVQQGVCERNTKERLLLLLQAH